MLDPSVVYTVMLILTSLSALRDSLETVDRRNSGADLISARFSLHLHRPIILTVLA